MSRVILHSEVNSRNKLPTILQPGKIEKEIYDCNLCDSILVNVCTDSKEVHLQNNAARYGDLTRHWGCLYLWSFWREGYSS